MHLIHSWIQNTNQAEFICNVYNTSIGKDSLKTPLDPNNLKSDAISSNKSLRDQADSVIKEAFQIINAQINGDDFQSLNQSDINDLKKLSERICSVKKYFHSEDSHSESLENTIRKCISLAPPSHTNSLLTTKQNPSSTDEEKPSSIENAVSIHTSQNDFLSSQETTNTLTNKKKKKKKKKKASKQIISAMSSIAQQFSASSKDSPPSSKKITSLFSEDCEAYCPKFTEDEKKLLTEILENSSFCDNITLFEAFLIEFSYIWKEIDYQIRPMMIQLQEDPQNQCIVPLDICHEILNINKDQSITSGLFNLFLFYYRQTDGIFTETIQENFDEKLFTSVEDVIETFQIHTTNIEKYINEIIEHNASIQTIMKKTFGKTTANAFKIKQMKNLTTFYNILDRLQNTLNLCSKCLSSKNIPTFLVSKKTSDWSESQTIIDHENLIIMLSRYCLFLDTINQIESFYDEDLSFVIDSIKNMIANRFNKKSVTAYLTHQPALAKNTLQRLFHLYKIIKNGPSSEDNSINAVLMLIKEISDKWNNDVGEALMSHSVFKDAASQIQAPQIAANRIKSMLEKAISFDINAPVSIRKADIDPSLQLVLDDFAMKLEFIEVEHKNHFAEISFVEMHDDLRNALEKPFRLSLIAHSILPLCILENHFPPHRFDLLRKQLLTTLHSAKDKIFLDHLDPRKLKEDIQNWLLDHCFKICTYTMILADANHLISSENDIMRMMPRELFNLLKVEGFDELFLRESPQILTVDQALTVDQDLPIIEDLGATENFPNTPIEEVETKKQVMTKESASTQEKSKPKPQKITQSSPSVNTLKVSKISKIEPKEAATKISSSKKEDSLPTTQDFNDAENEKIMKQLLERMNYQFESIHGSHCKYRNLDTRKIVIVPNHKEIKHGTRQSIRKQAFLGCETKDD